MFLVKLNDTSTGLDIRWHLDEIADGVEDYLPERSVELQGSYCPAESALPISYIVTVDARDRSVTVMTPEDWGIEVTDDLSAHTLGKVQLLAWNAISNDWQNSSSRLRQHYWPNGPRWRSRQSNQETLIQPHLLDGTGYAA